MTDLRIVILLIKNNNKKSCTTSNNSVSLGINNKTHNIMANIKHGDLITLENGDVVEVSLKVVKKKEIVPIAGNTYKLKYTGEFCHWYGSQDFNTGGQDLSKHIFQYVGNVITSSGERAIFYCDDRSSYVMLSIKNFGYIVEQI
jgi:hypothetical protein